MRAIIIGAGRGRRLMPTTADSPKCFAEIGGKRILDWIVEALTAQGVDDICFIGGWSMEKVVRDYPDFTFRENTDWPNNNILASLMCAEDLMDRPFISTYSDILYTARALAPLAQSTADITLLVDTGWSDRYVGRTEHPPTDAEKVQVSGGRVTRVHRGIPPGDAYGEFTGVARFGALGAQQLRAAYHHGRERHAGGPFREAAVFEKAYLIHLLQQMIEDGTPMHHVDTPGEYWEIDTQQDFDAARRAWGQTP